MPESMGANAASQSVPRILPLPGEVVERIAAGEVIERPASVVRELIDNALDAGATTIRVELRDGGVRLIRVVDDGCGIAEHDLAVACQSHTTSKVHQLSDLNHISTLGFRGEALASVAAVAELEMASACDETGLAHVVTIIQGSVVERSVTSRPRGTTVTVRNLFHDVPARHALLRGPRGEAARVVSVVRSYALAHPAVRFVLNSDGHLMLQTPGTTLADAVAALYGSDVACSLLSFGPRQVEETEITGVVAARNFHHPHREHVLLVVNGRLVTNRVLLAGMEAGYRAVLRKGRHPLLVAVVSATPEQLDVTVHPAKAEVLLYHESAIAAALRSAIHQALGNAPLTIPVLGSRPIAAHFARPLQLRLPAPHRRRGLRANTRRVPLGKVRYAEVDEPGVGRMPTLEPLAQFDETLILARTAEGHLYLVDQHRAHERILYEHLLRQRMALSYSSGTSMEQKHEESDHESIATGQFLLDPILVELTARQAALLTPRLDELATMGLACQPFGGTIFLVRSLPYLPGSAQSPASAVQELACAAAEDSEDWLDHLCVSLACRSAVRRGHSLTLQEQQALLTDLHGAETHAVCPHGSPLLLRYSRGFLTRAFEW